MRIALKRIFSTGKNGQRYGRWETTFQCDNPDCRAIFTRKGKFEEQEIAFCNGTCMARGRMCDTPFGQKIAANIAKSVHVRFDDPVQGPLIRNKISKSNKLARANDPTIVERSRETCIKNNGCDQTTLMRREFVNQYGISSPSQLEHVKKIASATMKSLHADGTIKHAFVNKYGVDNPWKDDGVRKRCELTSIRLNDLG